MTPISIQLFETPPRTWRGRKDNGFLLTSFGNTSTHVERTNPLVVVLAILKKHLHARGEDSKI